MQFSLKRLLILFAFANLLIAAAFVFPPILSMIVFTFVALVVLPPIIMVGVVQTRGSRQAFFLGAMVTGTPHFIINLYLLLMFSAELDFSQLMATDDDFGYFGMMHLGFIVIGTLGGLMGMAAHAMLLPASKSSDLSSTVVGEAPIASPWDEKELASDGSEVQQVKLPR